MSDATEISVHTFHYDDFTLVMERDRHWVNFKVYECVGSEYREGGSTRCYNRREYEGSGEIVTDLADAQVYCSGHVMCTGCSNWRFDEQDHVMLHFCGRHSARLLSRVVEAVYDRAAELIGSYDKEAFACDGSEA